MQLSIPRQSFLKQTQENCLIDKTTSLSIHINLAKDTDTGLLTHLFLDGSLTTVFLDFLFFKHTKDIVSSALSRKKRHFSFHAAVHRNYGNKTTAP